VRGVLLQIDSGQRVVQLDAVDPAAMGDFVLLVRELEAGLDALTATTFERLKQTLPTWMVDTVFSDEEISELVRASLRAELRGFRRGILPDRCPGVDALGAQAAAKVGELKLLLSGYRISQMALWEMWFDSVERSVEGAQERNELLRHGSDYFFRYAGLLSDYVTDLYQRELEQAARTGEQRRFHAIRNLLEGKSLVGSQLDVDLEQHHLGLVAWGEGGEAAARELASVLGRPLLATGPLNDSWWGWLSGSHALGPGDERELKRFQPSSEAGIALGLEAFGEAGFRATNRQALRARWVARKTDRSVVFYADVAVEALASDNQADARAFVAHELRGIDDDSAASQRIRETIVAYFAAEHNAASAAAVLGVHQQTVANRLRAAEERLGRPVGARRVELETALRLRACLSRDA
jgi:PucR-like helix-turn-helix protein